ncbi:hypothetical protein BGZ61DRAFT_462386 [Ilyonectria robusta]|uniref:uncharacterized protein n=1 Tax=Ilyonectria robusta TaxID=1079257 RepID=UPI001E8EDFAA|nr:uncharacterized protein BGZ61DRAFT_462386 [Ilyonectria robusta]KAH8664778.1 hypothetical protein BGZ61DRAFT_462386 [Ilyonectria robusta]
MTPQDSETSRDNGVVLDAQHSLVAKPVKSQQSDFHAKSSPKSIAGLLEHGTGLPDPEYRNVAGHVSRRPVSVRAEPPPTSSSRATSTPQRRQEEQRKRRRRRLGKFDDDDSDDSDSDDRKKNHGKGGLNLPTRRQRTQLVESYRTESLSLELEEERLMALQQALQGVSNTWDNIGRYRTQCQEEGARRKVALIEYDEKEQRERDLDLLQSSNGISQPENDQPSAYKLAGPYLVRAAANNHSNCHRYLDNALYRDISGKLDNDSILFDPFDHLGDILERTEKGVVRRCNYFNKSRRNWGAMPQKYPDILISIIASMQKSVWKELFPKGPFPADITREIRAFLATKKGCNTVAEGFSANLLVDGYLEKIIASLADAMRLDWEGGRTKPNAESLCVVKALKASRQGGILTTEYLDWAWTDVNRNELEKAGIAWQHDLQSSRIETFRRTMADAKMTVKQRFIPDVMKQGTLSLVLFKGNYPSTVLEVEPHDLERLGWWYDMRKGTYWRYEIYADHPAGLSSRRETVFKVSIDGEVFSMLTLSGKWLDWEAVNDRGSDIDQPEGLGGRAGRQLGRYSLPLYRDIVR